MVIYGVMPAEARRGLRGAQVTSVESTHVSSMASQVTSVTEEGYVALTEL